MPIGILRLPNLLIVALTQYLLQYLVLLPNLHLVGLHASLDHWHFFLFVFTTLLITAGGYIINDILDYKMDLVNKPQKVFINASFTRRKAILLYSTIVWAGFAIAWYLALFVKHPNLVLIYPTAVLLLWLYSHSFKKMPLVGNIVVALFCAGVAGIVLFAERKAFQQLFAQEPAMALRISLLFGGYVVFAFYSTLLREIIKDMEDVDGDRTQGLRTMPIAFGFKFSKWATAFFALLLALMLVLFSIWLFDEKEWLALVFACGAVILPLLYIVFSLQKAEQKKDFSRLSLLSKLVMASGLVLLILISI